jgi:predicted TIM-barrel fold metal-dependent hydrolase
MVTLDKPNAQTPLEANPNAWRASTPGHEGWTRTAQPGDPNKYFIVSADCHGQEPADLWAKRIEPEYRHRIPRQEVDKDGTKWSVTEGHRPIKIRDLKLEGEDDERNGAGYVVDERLRDMDRDGIDVELIFPNKGLSMWATPDAVFSQAMCRVWNDWSMEQYDANRDRMVPVAAIAPNDLKGAIAEVKRAANMGHRALSLPNRPVWGPGDGSELNYNMPHFDDLWAAIQDADLPITLHISTGKDPRGARGNGGAIINYAVHSLSQSLEPVANFCSSGVLEKFPKLRIATIEAGIGWVPWALTAMDEAYHKHHMWSFPKLQMLPSEHYRNSFFASFGEDPPGLALAKEFDLMGNYMWANDYPHQEGTWPHSAAAIERTMGDLTDDDRAKLLGLNAARFLNIEVPPAKR